MATIHASIAGALIALTSHLPGQQLDDAEVRIPYRELKQLLSRAESPPAPEAPEPALLSARLRLSVENRQPVIDASFRIMAFSDRHAQVPLIAGDVALESYGPGEALVVVSGKSLCLVSDVPGIRTLELRLLPLITDHGFSVSLPPCPSVIFETGELPDDQAVTLDMGKREETLTAGEFRPLPNTGHTLVIRLLGSRETREALLPPEPSSWSWQHQALVTPADGELVYQVIARASATDGSGVEALLPLPPDAREITVSGGDLVSHATVRGENRESAMSLVWKTRGILDRQVMISYRMPVRPLDPTWRLQAPGGEGTRTRFIIASSPLLAYAAEGLSEPLAPQGLPAALAESLNGMNCRHLEAGTSADLKVDAIPVAATDEGVVRESEWSVKIEPDGSMLATGVMVIEHKGPLGFVFDTPGGMKLLSCELDGRPVSPVDLGGGRLKVTLPPQGETSRLACAFTRKEEALDPVEGTLVLFLPQTPLFIHTLQWRIELPDGYQAETHGNLTRVPVSGAPPSRIALRKNLCRDERPEVHVFYHRADLTR